MKNTIECECSGSSFVPVNYVAVLPSISETDPCKISIKLTLK